MKTGKKRWTKLVNRKPITNRTTFCEKWWAFTKEEFSVKTENRSMKSGEISVKNITLSWSGKYFQLILAFLITTSVHVLCWASETVANTTAMRVCPSRGATTFFSDWKFQSSTKFASIYHRTLFVQQILTFIPAHTNSTPARLAGRPPLVPRLVWLWQIPTSALCITHFPRRRSVCASHFTVKTSCRISPHAVTGSEVWSRASPQR